MPSIKIILAICLLALHFVIGLYDVWCAATGNYRSTVSWVVNEWATNFPVVAFAMGFLIGHLLWPLRPLN